MAKLSLFVLAAALVLVFVVSGGLATTCKLSINVWPASTDCTSGDVYSSGTITINDETCTPYSSNGANFGITGNCTSESAVWWTENNQCTGNSLSLENNQCLTYQSGSVRASFGSAARLANWISAIFALF